MALTTQTLTRNRFAFHLNSSNLIPCSITANTALRLARYFGTSERFWLNLQSHYDLEVERDRLGATLQKEVQVLANTD